MCILALDIASGGSKGCSLGRKVNHDMRPGANIINYGLFAVIYGTQLFREESVTIYGLIHRYIYIYILCYEIMSVNIDNIGP
jgi:hypothetical protein